METVGVTLTMTEAASQESLEQAVAALQANNQPIPECCEAAAVFAADNCQCDALLLSLIPTVGLTTGGFLAQLQTLSLACASFEVAEC
jgi:hypothetical protein